jgi:DNA (cytosine-5)-methyltransferase 1
MDFIDLFAGLGGFHIALRQLGHRCVFASEIDEELRQLYLVNFGMMPEGDIRKVNVATIPKHDILCAGFPCQPFSKAGDQDGIDDPELGELYKEILKVIKYHHPKYIILENVPNLEKHDDGKTWDHIEQLLRKEGYQVKLEKFSPDDFGIPQIRERVYIVCSLDSLENFVWPAPVKKRKPLSIEAYLDKNPKDVRYIPEQINRCIDVWQEFLDQMPKDEKIIHPLWSMEFGATYPYEEKAPWCMTISELRNFQGSHGASLKSADTVEDALRLLPSHARPRKNKPDEMVFPKWKIDFIKKNRDFYASRKGWLDSWIPKIKDFPSSLQKLEWNCQGEARNIRDYIIQVRPSGVRVKRRTTSPSLVAMTATQVPIIAWQNRYMTPKECMRIQSMNSRQGLKSLPKSPNKAYEALGNAINVKVATLVAKALVGEEVKSCLDGAFGEPTLVSTGVSEGMLGGVV